jgi:long-subunit fatty acid transport protein
MSERRRWQSAWAVLPATCCVVLAALPATAQEQPLPDAFALLVSTQSRPSFSILGAGARAAGMGGAFTAVADDASAASFNPAGLALLVKPEVSLVLDGRQRRERHGAFVDHDEVDEHYAASTTSFVAAAPNFAAFTVPVTLVDRNLSFQLSYQRLIDFDHRADRVLVERDGAGNVLATGRQRLDQNGALATFSIAAAYQLTQRLSLGLTVSRWQGSWSFASQLREDEVSGSSQALRLAQDNEWTGWNATLGALLRYRYLNLGATVRTPFDGDYTVSSRLATEGTPGFALPRRLDASLRWPASWTIGLAIKPREVWLLTADYAEYDWDDMLIEGLGEDGSERVNFFDLRPPESSTVRNTGQWRFGSELTLFAGEQVVTLRGGYFREPRPQLLAPGDEHDAARGWSLGAGLRRGQVSIDVAWQRASGRSQMVELVDPDALAGGDLAALPEATVGTSEQRVFVSVLYQFRSRASVRRLFHFLFIGPLPASDGEEDERGTGGEEGERGGDG